MAESNPEQGRPPEALSLSRKRRNLEQTNIDLGLKNENGNFNIDIVERKQLLEDGVEGVSNLFRQRESPKLSKSECCKETLRKVFFAKRSSGSRKVTQDLRKEEEEKNVPNINNNEIVTVSGSVENNIRSKRNSFHQDVEEALNSLLWQPYEYQNKQKISDGSVSSSSSCSSLSSSGLESSNNGTERNGNAADLHLLVNNLHVNRLSQSRNHTRSRDVAEQHSGTYLSLGVSPIECGLGAVSRRAQVPRYTVNCDELNSAMRVEIQPQLSGTRTDHAISISTPADNITSAQTARNNNVAINLMHHNGASNTQTMIQQRNPLHPTPVRGTSQSNLSSVNVVGLPSHPRQGSVPASIPGRNLLIPTHSRNTSEPFRAPNNGNHILVPSHPRNGSEPVTSPYRPTTTISNANIVSILNHQRYTTNLTNPNVNTVNHIRSSSMPYQQNAASGINNSGQLNVAHQRNGSDVNARSSRIPLNVSNVNVNYYRAVPVNVVSAVPTIQCFNSTDSNNVSNVNIVQAMPVTAHTLPITTNNNQTNNPQFNTLLPTLNNTTTSTTTCTEVIVHSSHEPVTQLPPQNPVRTRTFTSTEAQTDDTVVQTDPTREQRRRERRERRHQRRTYTHRHNNPTTDNSTQFNGTQTEHLPDLLNNTLPPPYSTMPANGSQMVAPMGPPQPPPVLPANIIVPPGTIVQSMVPNNIVPSGLVPNAMVPFHPQVVQGQVPLVQGAGPVPVPVPSPTGFRFPFPAGGFRRSRYSEEPPKSCCGLLAWRPGSLRWFIALIALVAVCCVLVGTALGAMRPAGRDHLTVSLLMIGVGIILVTVSGVAWRLTSHDSSTCRSMLGLGSTESVEVCTRRFVPRLPPSYGRPHHPYAAMMYPEFQYRPPPPSYQASMQEYRLRLLLLDRGNTPQIQAGIQNAVSPPPTYRSHSGSLLRAPLSNRREVSHSEYSCPPSYRSQTSSSRPATIMHNNSIIHSREQSLSLSESNHGGSVVNVVNILSTNDEDIALDNITLDSLKLEPDNDINPLKMLLKGSSSDLEGSKEGNLVTIVQTNDQHPVIVTVSGSSNSDNCNNVRITEIPSEMEILAHL